MTKWPLWSALILYWLITALLLIAALSQTPGHLGYPLDDTYIHMAIARHWSEDGYWGVSQTGFSSTSSSPLWTLLIALVYRLFGVNDWTPIALGVLSGSLTLVVAWHLLRKRLVPLRLAIFLMFVLLLAPLPFLTLTGMEHILHGVLSLGLIYAGAGLLSTPGPLGRRLIALALLSACVTITRYEGLFLVFTISLLLVLFRRVWAGGLVAAAGLLPVGIYGAWCASKGWFWLPNSVILKGNMPALSFQALLAFLVRALETWIRAPYMLMICAAFLIVYLSGSERQAIHKREKFLILIWITIAFFHMLFASTGWLYRYEAYLILTASVILVDTASRLLPSSAFKPDRALLDRYVVSGALVLLLIFPAAMRTGWAFRDYPRAITNIFEQQYQMALFVKSYYQGKTIAANDIGAIAYLANVRVVDLVGLGSLDIALARRQGSLDAETIAEITSGHGVELAIIYDSWFEENRPPEWVQVGTWQIADNAVCASDTVSFYAIHADRQEDAIANLRRFAAMLPPTIRQSGKYLAP